MSRSPLVQAAFAMQNTPDNAPLKLGSAVLSYENGAMPTSQFDIHFYLKERPKGIQLEIEYSADLFRPETIDRMGLHYLQLLESIAQDADRQIGRLNILPAVEGQQLLNEFNDTAVNYPRDQTVADLFIRQVAQTPDHPAVLFEDRTISYRQLDQDSNRLAHYLRELGIREDMPVALCLDRSFYMITAILGILKAGGAYVPIDPDYPAQRIAFVLQDTRATVLVTDSHSRPALPPSYTGKVITLDLDGTAIGSHPVTAPLPCLRPDHLAYIIYTSGSTGTPKGVMIEHRNVVRLFMTDTPLYDFNEHDVWTLFNSFCFDFSVWEIFGALLFGGRLVIVPKDITRDAVAYEKITHRSAGDCFEQYPFRILCPPASAHRCPKTHLHPLYHLRR